MTWINEVFALPAVLVWLLVFRGFWPHIKLGGDDALHFMVRGVVFTSVALILRTAYWDIFRPLLRLVEALAPQRLIIENEITNAFINGATTVAGLFLLAGLLRTIPEQSRSRYNIFTAAFYPAKERIRLRPREDEV